MREIILDTETTGLDPKQGHRIVEIGAIELYHLKPTGRVFQCYINPERDIHPDAERVSGLSRDFLSQFKTFPHVVEDFLAFIQESPLVIHNAPFDMRFLNAEMQWLNRPVLANTVVDTLIMARKKFPGSPANLDALCRRFNINNKHRDKHGALVDSELLVEVYIELLGGRQPTLGLGNAPKTPEDTILEVSAKLSRTPRVFSLPEAETHAHDAFIQQMKAPLWTKAAAS